MEMDALLLTEVRAREHLGLDRRSEGSRKVQLAVCREQQDALRCRENEYESGAGLDLADEAGYQDLASDRPDEAGYQELASDSRDASLRLFWR